MLNELVGSTHTAEGKEFVTVNKGRSGIAVYGPYTEYDPGKYVVKFCLSLVEDDKASLTENVVAMLEVTTLGGSMVLAETTVFASHLLTQDHINLAFSLSSRVPLEFRVHTTGYAALRIDDERIVLKIPENEKDFSPVFTSEEAPNDAFFIENFNHFRCLHDTGASISRSETGIIATFSLQQISCYIKNVEDFQLMDEIFTHQLYNFRISKKCIAVDIGMNIGLASLYLASLPNVVNVYSFEPFKAPYERALDNFGLNPLLSRKIKSFNYGLGGKDETHSVLIQEEYSIGTSVRGHPSGDPQNITIKDASAELSKLIADAKRRDLEVVLKVDCEGSEFPIFDVLEKYNLIKDIRIFVIEWHKWWSIEKTQEDLIRPLINNGFVVFDHTRPTDLWAGQLYAARTETSARRWGLNRIFKTRPLSHQS